MDVPDEPPGYSIKKRQLVPGSFGGEGVAKRYPLATAGNKQARIAQKCLHTTYMQSQSKNAGSTPLTGDGHSLGTVNHTVPTALSQDSHAVILEIPESIRPAREHLHFSVEALGDAI